MQKRVVSLEGFSVGSFRKGMDAIAWKMPDCSSFRRFFHYWCVKAKLTDNFISPVFFLMSMAVCFSNNGYSSSRLPTCRDAAIHLYCIR
jgi:hypothetical protein